MQIEIDKPLGLKLGDSKSPGGGLKVTGVSGNATKSGIKVGDTVIYTSSFFGDELWPADKLGFARSAIGACPSPVCFVYVSLFSSIRPSHMCGLDPANLSNAVGCLLQSSSLVGADVRLHAVMLMMSGQQVLGLLKALVHGLQVQGENKDINVKRLAKRPIPPRFGRRLTPTQKEKATHICVDCGYIYCDS